MRIITFLSILALSPSFYGFSGLSQASDEFGARFSEDTPSALQDPEKALADIMPAAGDKEIEAEQSEDEAYYNTDNPAENAAAKPLKVDPKSGAVE